MRNVADESVRPFVDMSAGLCGSCHTGAHHPTFDEWQLSKHAMALEGLRSNAFAQDSCLECHSQDYRHAVEEQAQGADVQIPTVETAQLSLECVTCHAPHGGVPQVHQLRKPVAALCGECHTQEEATLGDTPHHPQIEMLTGTGAFAADGSALAVLFSPHASLADEGGKACAQCHVVRHEVADPNEGAPNVTGHTFNPFAEESIAISPGHEASKFNGCLECHTQEAATAIKTLIQYVHTTPSMRGKRSISRRRSSMTWLRNVAPVPSV